MLFREAADAYVAWAYQAKRPGTAHNLKSHLLRAKEALGDALLSPSATSTAQISTATPPGGARSTAGADINATSPLCVAGPSPRARRRLLEATYAPAGGAAGRGGLEVVG
jgi:hypothetical protein